MALLPAKLIAAPAVARESAAFAQAAENGRVAADGLERCHRFLQAWLRGAEPTTGLIPRNLIDSPYWNGKDSAADNYPFMVLSAHFTDRAAFDGPMRRMLANEAKLTARPGWLRLTDDYNLKGTPGLRHPTANAERIIFNSAEYVKDGLLALTEWLGPSPWSERMFALVDDSFALATVDTPFGKVPMAGRNKEAGVEVSGDFLQALARLYWMSGRDEKYLQWGARLADLYLLPEGKRHPTRDFTAIRLRDHCCEIVSGLCEFYATVALVGRLPGGEAWAKKHAAYRPHLHEMLDRILAIGRNEDGLLWNEVNPQTGAVIDAKVSDSWGYVFDGYYTVFLIDGTEAYRDAALKPLTVLAAKYRRFNWEPRSDPKLPMGSHDGYADSIEGAINLFNRAVDNPRAAAVIPWIDSEMKELFARQQPDGLIEKWHGDGNFARTVIMYCLWKSQGLSVQPWRKDVRLGAVRSADKILVSLSADQDWSGTLVFDRPRHAENLRLPIDWPRINQFPEWFVARRGDNYSVAGVAGPKAARHTGEELQRGIPVRVTAGREVRFEVARVR
ncbi:MAG: hypothetical protein Q7S40_00075 [Opitutaceae bacterium]|nr:hypothetical protein [Opitutaceae bacterium]